MNTLDTTLQFQEHALKVSSQRQQLVASNIANADTPNYQAQDLNFAQTLQRAQAGQGGVKLTGTAPGHIISGSTTESADAVVYATGSVQPTMDGNTVDMDQQRGNFAEATLHYQAAFTFLNAQIKTLLSSIQG